MRCVLGRYKKISVLIIVLFGFTQPSWAGTARISLAPSSRAEEVGREVNAAQEQPGFLGKLRSEDELRNRQWDDPRKGTKANIRYYLSKVQEFIDKIADSPDEKVVIIYHPDADGIVSTVIMKEILRAYKPNVSITFIGSPLNDEFLLEKMGNAKHVIALDNYFPEDKRLHRFIERLSERHLLYIDHHDWPVKVRPLAEIIDISRPPGQNSLDLETPERLGGIYISPKRMGSSLDSTKYNVGLMVKDIGCGLLGAGYLKRFEWLSVISCYGDATGDKWQDMLSSYSKEEETFLLLSMILNSVVALDGFDMSPIMEALSAAKDPSELINALTAGPKASLPYRFYLTVGREPIAKIEKLGDELPADGFIIYMLTPDEQVFNGIRCRPARIISNRLTHKGGKFYNTSRVLFILQRIIYMGRPAVEVEATNCSGNPGVGDIMRRLFNGGGHPFAAGGRCIVEKGQSVDDLAERMIKDIRTEEIRLNRPPVPKAMAADPDKEPAIVQNSL